MPIDSKRKASSGSTPAPRAVRTRGATAPPSASSNTATLHAMEAQRQMIREFNRTKLVAGHGTPTMVVGEPGALREYAVPRTSGELVASHGGGDPASELWNGLTQYDKVVKTYDAATDRANASPLLRKNADDFRRNVMKQTGAESSGLGNQAQHVLPFQVALERKFDLGTGVPGPLRNLFHANTEHPHNAQFLPERAEFLQELEGLHPTVNNHSATVPAGTDISGMSGSYHEGFHSAYNEGTAQAIQTILNGLARTNTRGKVTADMAEAAMFAVQSGGREYATRMLPLYNGLNREGIKHVFFEHFTQEEVNGINAASRSKELAPAISNSVQEYGQMRPDEVGGTRRDRPSPGPSTPRWAP